MDAAVEKINEQQNCIDATRERDPQAIMTNDYQGPDRRSVAPPEHKQWWQTVTNNIVQWFALIGTVASLIIVYADFQTKIAVREAKIDASMHASKERQDRAEESIREETRNRRTEKGELLQQINGSIELIRGDIQRLRDELPRRGGRS